MTNCTNFNTMFDELDEASRDLSFSLIHSTLATQRYERERSRKREEQLRAELMRKYSKPVTLNRD